jgi:hypothetical protein
MARPFLVPFRRLLRLAGSRWRYSTPPPHGLYCTVSFSPFIDLKTVTAEVHNFSIHLNVVSFRENLCSGNKADFFFFFRENKLSSLRGPCSAVWCFFLCSYSSFKQNQDFFTSVFPSVFFQLAIRNHPLVLFNDTKQFDTVALNQLMIYYSFLETAFRHIVSVFFTGSYRRAFQEQKWSQFLSVRRCVCAFYTFKISYKWCFIGF